ncbi:unnamed protein product [Arabidopsis thaliana]|uniref:(thale cress) hypothetical protein n=1 Tax=Arabidopsis thaliana TaxID=3702 RepID=A0A7G2E2L8_ARATH|nr:unnamed protein product [Arabidopsis thaliana]
MAFLSKVGRLFSQTSSHVTASSSMLQSIRCMSSSKIFVGGISYSTDEFGLREAFSKYGEVVDAKIIVDRETGRSRGFAFVTFTSTEEASNAMQLDGQDLHGRRIRVNYATERGSSSTNAGFDDKFESNQPLGNDTDHQTESGLGGDEQFGGSDNQFGDAENGNTENGPVGFDQTDDGDVAKRA